MPNKSNLLKTTKRTTLAKSLLPVHFRHSRRKFVGGISKLQVPARKY